MASKVLLLAAAVAQLLARGAEAQSEAVTSRRMQFSTTAASTTAAQATATAAAPAAATPAAPAPAAMSMTQVIGILVGGGMILIGLCLVAYIFYLNKKLQQEAKDRYHDEEEGQVPVPPQSNKSKATRNSPAAPAAGTSPARRPSFDKSAAIREHAAMDAELCGPVHERVTVTPQKFPTMSPPKPAAAAFPAPTPKSQPQQQSPPRSVKSAFPGIPLQTPPQPSSQAQQQAPASAPTSAPAPAPVRAPAPAPAPAPTPVAAPARTPATTSPAPSSNDSAKKKYVELSDVFGED